MARGHWQIAKPQKDGGLSFGGVNTVPVDEAPAAVINAAVRCARLIGDGLYGIDLKENEQGVFVIEINDNPNLETEDEGAVLKDELWRRIINWFAERLEKRMGGMAAPTSPITAPTPQPIFARAGAK
jgi:glutathione synthase/RimK-type ligase-like ATP-grasp enzyme